MATSLESAARPQSTPALAFLRTTAPFDRMSEATLEGLAAQLERVAFARSETILSAQSGPVAHLYIVAHGIVGSRANRLQAHADLAFGPGQMFPVGVLSVGGATTRLYYALQDTECFRLPRDAFVALREASPEFDAFCAAAVSETLRQSLESLHTHYSQAALAEQQAGARSLGELVRNAPVACAASAPLRDAVQAMADARVSTIVAVDAEAAPVGILTALDLLRRVVLPGRSLDEPLATAMTQPIVTLPATDSAQEAMQVMAERGIRHLAVVEEGKLAGVLSERDLFVLQRVSMSQVVESMHAASSLAALRRAAQDIHRLTQNLLAQGVAAEPMTRTIAALNDALTRRVIELVLSRHDIGEVGWCWLALGSEGRREQTFATDQDNALLFVGDDGALAARRERLLAFAREVNAALDTVGFPLCKGKVMAGNPEYCLSLEEWKKRFLQWICSPTEQGLLGANIVFDFRALYGEAALADELRTWLLSYTPAHFTFLRLIVGNALAVEPPLGLVRTFSTDDVPGAKGTIDLKGRGTRVFVDCGRAFALALGFAETSTVARLRLAADRLGVATRHVDATVEAFHFLQLLRLRQQDVDVHTAHPNRIDPNTLHDIDRKVLKEAFRQAKLLQERLRFSYRL